MKPDFDLKPLPSTRRSRSDLRHDWYGAIRRISSEPSALPPYRVRAALDCAAWFVADWADWAELVGMQPAHLLARLPGRLGIAWRWSEPSAWWPTWAPIWEVVCFPHRGLMVAECPSGVSGIPVVYRFCPDGGVELVRGDEYHEIMTTKVQLDELPTARAAYIAASVARDG